MRLDLQSVAAMAPGRMHKHGVRLNSLDFHRSEDRLVTASDDKGIRLYDTNTGEELNVIWSKKYGAACIAFTHAPSAVVYASRERVKNECA